MQKFLNTLILIAFVGLSIPVIGQNADFKSNISLSYNYTFTGDLLNDAIDILEQDDNSASKASFPSVQFAYDFGVEKYLSIGIAASYEDIGIEVTGNEYFDEMGNLQIENFRASYTRFSVALRPLLHYANNDKLDMYSGLRIQYFNGKFNEDSGDTSIDEDYLGFNSRNKVGVAITVFGIRYFFIDNLGLGWEFNIGRPYVTNLNLNIRF